MIVQNHDINLHSHNSQVTRTLSSQRISASPPQPAEIDGNKPPTGNRDSAFFSISGRILEQFQQSVSISGTEIADAFGAGDESKEEVQLPSKLQVTRKLLEKFFGIKVEIITPDSKPAGNTAQPSGENHRQINFSQHEIRYQKDSVRFSANGNVTTADGRELNFNVDMEMSRETFEEVVIELRAGNNGAIDPLAINFDGKGVRLKDEKFQFDLDSDGKMEHISFLEAGSGFLVFDRNQNGIADNGSELFGPETNNGFIELKAYDQDNSDWIDEKDAIFYNLSIWTKDEEGADHLSGLKDNGIGAIYLNSAETRFAMKQGQLRETGVYLKENGEANLIQEIDLLV